MRRATLATLVILVGACATTQWQRKDAKLAEVHADRTYCMQVGGLYGIEGENVGQAIIGVFVANTMFNRCMKSLGWREADDNTPQVGNQNAYVESIHKMFLAVEQERHKNYPETYAPFCSIPQYSADDLTVLRVSEYANRVGIRPGDKILAIDEIPVHTPQGLAREVVWRKPDATVRITIDRDGVTQNIDADCIDGLPAMQRFSAALNAGMENEWDECIFQIIQLEKLTFVASVTAAIKLSCNEAHRVIDERAPDNRDAILVYDATRLGLEEVKILAKGISDKRGSTLANIAWLESNGFQTLGDDLKSQLYQIDEVNR